MQDKFAGEIRMVLLRDWDPVGVGDNPHLSDEYDAYIPKLVRILRNPSASKESVVAYLQEIETDRMGLQADPERIAIAASSLVEIAQQD